MAFDRIAGRIVAGSTNVTSTATAIPSTAATGRKTIMVKNAGEVTVYLGGSTVTTATGYPLDAGEEKAFDMDELVVLYGITAAGTAAVKSLEGV